MLINKLNRLAVCLAPFRAGVIAVIVAFSLLTTYHLLTGNSGSDTTLHVALIGQLWSLLLFSLIQLFQRIPPRPTSGEGFFRRLSLKVKRFLYVLLALVFLATSVSLVGVSLRLMSA